MIKLIPTIKSAFKKLFTNANLGFTIKSVLSIYGIGTGVMIAAMIPFIIGIGVITITSPGNTGMENDTPIVLGTENTDTYKESVREINTNYAPATTPSIDDPYAVLDKVDKPMYRPVPAPTPFDDINPIWKVLGAIWTVTYMALTIFIYGFVLSGFIYSGIVIHEGKLVPIPEVLKLAKQKAIKMAVLMMICGLVFYIGLLLLIIPGILFSLMVMFAPYYLVREDIRVFEAIKRSFATAKGYLSQLFMRKVGIFLLSILLIIPLFMAIYIGGTLISIIIYMGMNLVLIEFMTNIESIKDMHRIEGEKTEINKGLETTSTI